jgi:transcriptional regulator of NAD metabolism
MATSSIKKVLIINAHSDAKKFIEAMEESESKVKGSMIELTEEEYEQYNKAKKKLYKKLERGK